MNNNLLRVFETESDYDSAKPDFIYPTVSYVRDVDEVKYMDAPQPLLPRNIDTNGYTTDFINGQYYPQEALVFKAIYDMYSSYLRNEIQDNICIESGELYARIMDEYGVYNRLDIAYVGNEPLYKNYLINFESDGDRNELGDICMHRKYVSFAQTSYSYRLTYSDGRYGSIDPV